MSPEERDIIGRFIARVGGAPAPGGFSGGSVPATQPALPAIDPEADRFIAEQMQAYPQARYRVTQMAFVQEAALAEAQNRIKQLDYQLGQATQALQQARQGAPSGQRGGFFSNLFGGGQPQGGPRYAQQPQYGQQPQYAPPPQASYPPGYQPGMFGGGGSGFLGSALTTAAGVAGGVLAADAISSMFSPHNYGGGFGGGGFGGGGYGGGFGGPTEVVNETVVNNYGDQADPWSGGAETGAQSGGGGQSGGDWGGGNDPGTDQGSWGGGGDSGGDSGGWDSGGDSSF